jgi:hypothetical protein
MHIIRHESKILFLENCTFSLMDQKLKASYLSFYYLQIINFLIILYLLECINS